MAYETKLAWVLPSRGEHPKVPIELLTCPLHVTFALKEPIRHSAKRRRIVRQTILQKFSSLTNPGICQPGTSTVCAIGSVSPEKDSNLHVGFSIFSHPRTVAHTIQLHSHVATRKGQESNRAWRGWHRKAYTFLCHFVSSLRQDLIGSAPIWALRSTAFSMRPRYLLEQRTHSERGSW